MKFKAPTFVDTSAGTGTVDPNEDLRYWSLCSLDLLENNEGLACIPDYLTVDSKGFVTIVYGPKGGAVENKAQALGYNFLPDNREALGVTESRWPSSTVNCCHRRGSPRQVSTKASTRLVPAFAPSGCSSVVGAGSGSCTLHLRSP